MNIESFKEEHSNFFNLLYEKNHSKNVSENDIKNGWICALILKIECVPVGLFKAVYGITFQDIADYWNKEPLKICLTGKV